MKCPDIDAERMTVVVQLMSCVTSVGHQCHFILGHLCISSPYLAEHEDKYMPQEKSSERNRCTCCKKENNAMNNFFTLAFICMRRHDVNGVLGGILNT